MSTTSLFRIEFDGGNHCNNPKSYGVGYGSYRLNQDGVNLGIHRVNHGKPMSNNAAETLTLVSAIEHVKRLAPYPDKISLLIVGDSQIVLNVVRSGRVGKKVSELYRDAVAVLRHALKDFVQVRTEWKARAHAVSLFGH